eukprot:TRINITY_DN1851_c0_g1_i1.p1 TRINITY_DN1851_c0_g1~~TRINITY_DN1851_c0_g1_i1.p1  ORF type:complete len:1614 (+),score=411.10 TRINITY_DN1851_c0_g1_i1:67-4842(+)
MFTLLALVAATVVAQDCVQKTEWPGEIQAMCGHLLYPSLKNSSYSEVIKREATIRALISGTGIMSTECELAMKTVACTADIIGCTTEKKPLQACSQHCENFMERCSAPIEAVRVDDSLNFPLLDCFKWNSPLSSCPAFERREPCLSVLHATMSTGSGVESAQSPCSIGVVSNSRDLINEAKTPSTESYQLQERELSYIIWPAAILLSIGCSLAFTSVINNNHHERGGQTFNLGERALSIRFCTQIISIILASGSCMIVFFVSTTQAEKDLKLSFSSARETQERTFITADESISKLSDKFLEQTALHTVTHVDRFLSIIETRHVQTMLPYTQVAATVANILQQNLLSMDSSLTTAHPFSVQVFSPDDSFTRIIHGSRASQFLGFTPPSGTTIAHIGFTNLNTIGAQTVRPATYDSNGVEVVAGVTSPNWVKVSSFTQKWFIVPAGQIQWSEPTVQLGHATLSVASTAYRNSVPLHTVMRYVTLEGISDTLKDKVQYNNERIVVVQNSSAALVIAASHGTLVREGKVASIYSINDPIVVSVVKGFLSVTNSTTISTVPLDSVHEVVDVYNETYFIKASMFRHSNLNGVAMAMVPLMEVKGSMIRNTLELRTLLDGELNRVRGNEKDSHRFLVLVSILLVFLALLLSLMASNATTTALMTMIVDLQDIAGLRLETAMKRQKNKPLSKLLEVRALQLGLRKTVWQLSEYRKYFPSAVMGMDTHGKDDEVDKEESLDGNDDIIDTAERRCTVHVVYISRNLEKRKLDNQDGLNSITKKSKSFEWHYTDPNHASLTSLQRECRMALGELVGEPLELSAVPSPDSDDEDDTVATTTYPLLHSSHLQDFLIQNPDEITIHVKKSGKANFLAPLTAFASVSGKIGLIIMVWNMYVDGDSMGLRLAPVQIVILVVGFTLNILWSFKLNRKANNIDEQMAEWTRYFQTETTLVMVLCGFNMQNILVLWSGLRIGKFLRFHAPMPRKVRHQAIRWSMFSLLVGDLLPLLVTMFYLSETDTWNEGITAQITITAQVVAILASSVKKFVVFCLVDDEKEEQEEKVAEEHRKAKARNARLVHAELTIIRVQLTAFNVMQNQLEAPDISKVLHAFYSVAMKSLRRHEGTVVSFSDGVLEGVFNYPKHSKDHEKLGCCAAAEIILAPLPEALHGVRQQHNWVQVSVVSDNFYKGNLGANGRRFFHYIGQGSQLSKALCRHCESIGARAVVGRSIADRLKNDVQHNEEFALRQIDLVSLPGFQSDVEVYQLLPLPRMAPDAFKLLEASRDVFAGVFHSVTGGGVFGEDPSAVLQAHLKTAHARGVRDTAAEILTQKINTGKVFPTILCECGSGDGRSVGTASLESMQSRSLMPTQSPSQSHQTMMIPEHGPMSPLSESSSLSPFVFPPVKDMGIGRRRGDTVMTNHTNHSVNTSMHKMMKSGSRYLNASVVKALLDDDGGEEEEEEEEDISETSSEIRTGVLVEIHGLTNGSSLEFNACKARVLRSAKAADQWVVHVLQTGTEVALPVKNLRIAAEDPSPEPLLASPVSPMTNASFSSIQTNKDRHSRVIATASTMLGLGSTPRRSPLLPPRRRRHPAKSTVASSVNLN